MKRTTTGSFSEGGPPTGGDDIFERFQKIVDREALFVPARPVVIGVSGGPDSLCLLDLVHRLEIPLVVAHFHHGLRSEADVDARAVQAIAGKLDLPFALGRAEVRSFAVSQSLSLEEAARNLRYLFLFSEAHRHSAQAVAVAHTADDQVETVLMHLLRGAGLDGLKGMLVRTLPSPWSQDIPLLRPLLTFWRQEVLEYLASRDLEPVFDNTNLDTAFFRNRLRHEVLPYLEQVKSGTRQALFRMAQVLAGDDQVLQGVLTQAWEGCVAGQGPGYVQFGRQALLDQVPGIQRRLLRRGIASLRPGLRDIDYASVARAVEFIEHPTQSGQVDLAAGLRLALEGDVLWLSTWGADLPGEHWPQMPLDLPATESLALNPADAIPLPSGWLVQAEICQDIQTSLRVAGENQDPYQAWIDAAQVCLPLRIRRRRPGDRFQPLGMGGHSLKLADFMVNVKIPARLRAGWPLVCASEPSESSQPGGGEIVWVPGYRLDHRFRLTPSTRQLIHLQMSKPAG